MSNSQTRVLFTMSGSLVGERKGGDKREGKGGRKAFLQAPDHKRHASLSPSYSSGKNQSRGPMMAESRSCCGSQMSFSGRGQQHPSTSSSCGVTHR